MKYIFLLLFLLSTSSCKKKEYSVQYQVRCGNCLIAYHDREGNAKSVSGNYGTWKFDFKGIPGRFVYLSVVSFPDNTGFVEIATAKIYVGNEEFRSGKSTTSNPEVTLSGYLDD